jgi:hypothetical protein
MKPLLSGALAGALSLAAALQAAQAASPKVTAVTLSSAGLAEIHQEAEVSGGDGVELSVPLDQVDDILKSLVVRDPGGPVVSVGLPGREPLAEAFRYLPFNESELANLPALLKVLQGRRVTVEGRGQKADGQKVSGRIVGVRREEAGDGAARHHLSLLYDDGAVGTFVLEAIDAIVFDDPEVKEMLSAALTATQEARAADARSVAISLAGSGERSVALSYVVAAPVWKAAYRLVLPEGDGEARLQGWAVVENMTGHDWEGVKLSLTSGRPVALRQALYESYRLQRPEIPVTAFGQVLPRPDRGGMDADLSRVRFGSGGSGTGSRPIPGPAAGSQEQLLLRYYAEDSASSGLYAAQDMSSGSQTVAADESMTSVRFDFPQPMDVPAGHSLTVPFIDSGFNAERVSVYQPDVDETHPIAAVRIRNAGEASLPPGILTFYDGAEGYAGDAQFLGAGPDESRLLMFAVDRKVRVLQDSRAEQRLRRVSVVDGVLRAESVFRSVKDYVVSGASDGDRSVVIEHLRLNGWTATVTGGEREDTPSHIRVSVAVPAGGTASVTVVDERPDLKHYALVNLDRNALMELVGVIDGVDDRIAATLKELTVLRASAAAAERRREAATQELTAITSDQSRVRSNLSSVPPQSELARRYLALLTEQEDQVEAAKQAQAAATAAQESIEAQIREAVHKLSES